MLDSIGSPLQKDSSGRRRGYYGGEVNAKEDRTGEAVLCGMLRLYMLHLRGWVYDVVANETHPSTHTETHIHTHPYTETHVDVAEALQGGCCSTAGMLLFMKTHPRLSWWAVGG